MTRQGLGFLAVVAAVLVVAIVVLVSLQVRSRGRHLRAIRAIVVAVEELRSGQASARVTKETEPTTALAFDAIERLDQELAARSAKASKTEDRLRALTESVKDGAVITTDTDGDIRSFSSGAAKMFGWEEREVVSRPAAILFEEESFRRFLPKLARRSLRERGVQTRAVLQHRDGKSFTADVAVTMIQGPSREAEGFVLVANDATSQVELEQQLRESEQRYRTLVDGLSDGVLIVAAGSVRYANRAMGAMLDVRAEQLIETPLRDRIATRDVLLVEERLELVQARDGATDDLRFGLLLPGGRGGPVVGVHATRVDFDGAPAVLLLLRDETRELRAEAELRRNESQLDAVLEATSDGVLALTETPEGAMVRMTNRAFTERFGLVGVSILGLSERQLSNRLRALGGGAATLADFLSDAGDEGVCELISVGAAPPRQLEATVSALRDRAGRRFGRVVAIRDLTEERESQRRLQQHTEELQLSKVRLEQSYRKLDAMNRELQEQTADLDSLNQELRKLDEMKSNLLGNVSHELQTPLVSIRGYTEMILKSRLGPITDEQRKGLDLCLRNIDRLISMIDNLLVFTRSGPEVGRLQLARFALRPLIEEAAEMLRDKMRARAIGFSLEMDDDELAVHADRDKVQQVFLNVMSNAIKFNRDGGTISIQVRAGRSGFVDVRVEDTGVGIPAEALERVFDRNYQVTRDPGQKPQGSGIGLSIVRDILRLHGCRISAESEEQHGTRFLFNLPATSQAVEPPSPARPEQPPADTGTSEPAVDPEADVLIDELLTEPDPGTAADDPTEPPTPRPRFRVIRPTR